MNKWIQICIIEKSIRSSKRDKMKETMDGDTEGQTLCAEYDTPFTSYTYSAPPIEILKVKDET